MKKIVLLTIAALWCSLIVLAKAKKKIDEAGRSLDEAQHRNDIIQKKLRAIEALDIAEADGVLEIEASEILEPNDE
jgi:hypothetical protein